MARIPSRKEILAHRKLQNEMGFQFTLEATSLGMNEPIVARVRDLDLFDRAAIGSLPSDVQAAVWDVLETSKREQDALNAISKGAAKNFDEFSDRGKHMLEIANKYVIASFIEPKVVATEAELETYPDAWVVDDIKASDRIAFVQISNNDDAGVSKKLKLFRPSTDDHVPDDAPDTDAASPA